MMMVVVIKKNNNIYALRRACHVPHLIGIILFVCMIFYSSPVKYVAIIVIPSTAPFST